MFTNFAIVWGPHFVGIPPPNHVISHFLRRSAARCRHRGATGKGRPGAALAALFFAPQSGAAARKKNIGALQRSKERSVDGFMGLMVGGLEHEFYVSIYLVIIIPID